MALPSYIDLPAYLLSRGYVGSRREARNAVAEARVSVNGKTYIFRHFPKAELDHDNCGRPRIMVDGVPDPRPCK